MKKFLAIFVALSMLLCVNALAEETPIEELEVELDETYVPVDLGENYAYTYLPADWTAIEYEYNQDGGELLGTFANAEGTAMLFVVYATSETATTYEEIYNQSIEAGLNANISIINGFEFVSIATVTDDQVTMICTYLTNEEGTEAIAFTFTFAAADLEAMETVVNQALGSFNFYEAEA